MKQLLLIFFFVSVICYAFSQSPVLSDTANRYLIVPIDLNGTKINLENFKAVSAQGQTYTEESFKDKIILLNFWFESCAPCIAEFEALKDLYEKYKNNKRFLFISFTFETKKDVLRIAAKYKLQYPIICISEEEIETMISGSGFPTNMVVDKNKIIASIRSGGPVDEKLAKTQIDSIIVREIDKLLSCK
jgi:thiol-disulfide isomerase/thioredoxin